MVPTDVSQPDQVEHLAEAALARFGRLDMWINNAAVGTIGRFEEVIETAPPALPTTGSLHEPVQAGTGVEGGARARMERKDRERQRKRRWGAAFTHWWLTLLRAGAMQPCRCSVVNTV